MNEEKVELSDALMSVVGRAAYLSAHAPEMGESQIRAELKHLAACCKDASRQSPPHDCSFSEELSGHIYHVREGAGVLA